MKATTQTELKTAVAARLAGEDIACGQFVSVLSQVDELASFLWNCSEIALYPAEPVRIRYVPDCAGQPYKVIAVCLPFVYVRTDCGDVLSLDTRRQQLVRLDQQCARRVWKKLKALRKKRKY